MLNNALSTRSCAQCLAFFFVPMAGTDERLGTAASDGEAAANGADSVFKRPAGAADSLEPPMKIQCKDELEPPASLGIAASLSTDQIMALMGQLTTALQQRAPAPGTTAVKAQPGQDAAAAPAASPVPAAPSALDAAVAAPETPVLAPATPKVNEAQQSADGGLRSVGEYKTSLEAQLSKPESIGQVIAPLPDGVEAVQLDRKSRAKYRSFASGKKTQVLYEF